MMNGEKVAAIIVAGGSSTRMGQDKLLARIQGKSVIQRSVEAFDAHSMIDEIVVVAGEKNIEEIQRLVKPFSKVTAVVTGGKERFLSVQNGMRHTAAAWLAIHDGARPFVSETVITKALEGALKTGCAAPAVPVKDTVKKAGSDGLVLETPDRSELFAVQTPQVVLAARYRKAVENLGKVAVTDDCMIMEQDGCPVQLTQGEYENRKITTPEDLAPSPGAAGFRVGHGYDVHRLVEGRKLILGGCEIPYEKGLLGHSDADVLTHAVMDALLGAAALGDIGQHFPDTDITYAGADSIRLLQHVCDLLAQQGWIPGNVDATLVCQKPKLAPYIIQMRERLAQTMGLGLDAVSVKATTEEKMGFTGSGEGISAHCVALLVRL